MIQDPKNQKGKFKPIKIPFHCESTYKEILEKCQEILWPNERNANFFLAGTSIQAGGQFELAKTIIPWTLQNYLKVSQITFPSRARIYLVNEDSTSRSIMLLCVYYNWYYVAHANNASPTGKNEDSYATESSNPGEESFEPMNDVFGMCNIFYMLC